MTAARTLDLLLLVAIWLAAAFMVTTPMFAVSPDVLGPAIVVDLTLTAALVHWVVGLRKGALPTWTLGVVLLVGAALGGVLVPGQTGLVLVLAVLAELVVASIAVVRMRTLVRGYRAARAGGDARGDAVEAGLAAALESPRLASAVRLESEIVLLALTGWFRRLAMPPGTTAFTHHQEASWSVIAGVLIFLSLGEGGALHLFLSANHPAAAWLVTGLHVYAVLWILGDAHGFRLRPSLLDERALRLRLGLRWRTDIDRASIVSAERLSADPEPDDLSLIVIGAPNVRLRLARPVDVRGIFGLERRSDRLAIQVDDPAAFVAALGAV